MILLDFYKALAAFYPRLQRLALDYREGQRMYQQLRSEVEAECKLKPDLDPDQRMLERLEQWLTQLEQPAARV